MDNLWDGFRVVDAGSLVTIIVIVFWWVRQFNKGKWHTDLEVQRLLEIQEKRFKEAEANAKSRIDDARARELEYRVIAERSNEAAGILREQLTAVVGELQIVGKTMHAINPSIQTEDSEAGR